MTTTSSKQGTRRPGGAAQAAQGRAADDGGALSIKAPRHQGTEAPSRRAVLVKGWPSLAMLREFIQPLWARRYRALMAALHGPISTRLSWAILRRMTWVLHEHVAVAGQTRRLAFGCREVPIQQHPEWAELQSRYRFEIPEEGGAK